MPEETTTVYRSFPENFDHPKFYKQIGKEEFEAIAKRQMEKVKGTCPGHKKTVIYFVDSKEYQRYIVEVVLDKGSIYIETPCTYTPTMGMDSLDGNLAQDAEEWILVQNLSYKSNRLQTLFGNKDKIYFNDYLRLVGLPHVQQSSETHQVKASKSDAKKWWKFW